MYLYLTYYSFESIVLFLWVGLVVGLLRFQLFLVPLVLRLIVYLTSLASSILLMLLTISSCLDMS